MKKVVTEHLIGHLDDFPDGTAILAPLENRQVCVLREGTIIRACSPYCPHQYATLEGSYADAGHIVCRYHGMRFSMEHGGCTNASGYSLEIVPLKVDSETAQVFALTTTIIED